MLTSSPGSNCHIDLLFDASTASAPAGFKTQIIQAAQYLDAIFTDNITVNISVGWGEIGGTPISSQQVVAEGGPSDYFGFSYGDVANFLGTHAVSAADIASVDNLPASDPVGPSDPGYWWITPTQLKLFDPADYPNDLTNDGSIGFSTGWRSDWLGAALHEITHALARVTGAGDGYQPTLFDLFRYASAGNLQLDTGPAYLSIDGGATKLADFGVASDTSDFKNDSLTPKDPFDEISAGDGWTPLDSTTMDVLGFTLAAWTVPSPTVTPPDLEAKSFTFDGRSVAWSILNGGKGVALPTETGLYLSADKTVTTADTLLGTETTVGLAAGHSEGQGGTLALPTDLAPGTYYLGVIANVIGDVNEAKTTNNLSNAIPILLGGAGNDTLKGTSTVHDLFGFGGDDILTAGPGSNVLDGGSGTDRAVLSGAFANFKITQTTDGYSIKGSSGTDTVANMEILQFSDRQMVLASTGETLTARASKDTLVGGSGDDTLIASPGKDVLTGGGGNDHFVFGAIADLKVSAPDTISDFVSGQDQIDISALNALLPGSEPFHLGATAGHVGDITIAYDAAHNRTVIDLFTNGDAKADGVIWLTGQHTSLTAEDFVL